MKNCNCIEILVDSREFNLEHIFDCGQCFRWAPQEDGSYTGIAKGKIANMAINKNGMLCISNCNEEEYETVWKNYLDMDRSYEDIKRKLSNKDSNIHKAMEFGYGIRILRQDLWEIIISFIISQNNNIPRIKKNIEDLSRTFGKYIGEYDGMKYYDIPSPEELAGKEVKDLEPIKLGYRGKYIIETAKYVASKGLPQSVEELEKLQGVGPKVKSCIALFGMNELKFFPIDVWVKRVMNRIYGIEEEDTKEMERFAEDTFGEYGGIAQQYLFYYLRSNPKA